MKARNLSIVVLVLTLMASICVCIVGADTLVTTSNSPATNVWQTSRAVSFSCTCTGNQTGAYNMTLWVGGTNVSNNASADNATATILSYTFTADQCTAVAWYCGCKTVNQSAVNSTARNIYVDASTPSVNHTGPSQVRKGSMNYLKFATGDNCAIASRWWRRVGVDDTNSTSFVETDDIETYGLIPGKYTFNYTVNDSAGNINSTMVDIAINKRKTAGVVSSGEELPDYTVDRESPSMSITEDASKFLGNELITLGDFVVKVWMAIVGVIVLALLYRNYNKK